MTARAIRVYGERARIGMIVPPTNTANEAEWARWVPTCVTLHAARMALHLDLASDAGLRALFADLEAALSMLTPASVDAVAYCCTGGSLLTPLDRITGFMRAKAGVPAVATAPALVLACRALGARRIALATPYHDALNAHETAFLAACGLEVVACRGLGIGAGGPHEFTRIAGVRPGEVRALALSADRGDADALVISCTDLATLEVIEPLERALGKPVITSNQATLWAALRAAGLDDRVAGAGRLLAA